MVTTYLLKSRKEQPLEMFAGKMSLSKAGETNNFIFFALFPAKSYHFNTLHEPTIISSSLKIEK